MKNLHITFLFILFAAVSGIGQQITGMLTNIDGDALIGANVVWQNTEIGTVTDENGLFSIEDIGDENGILLFSYVGFKTEKNKGWNS